MRAPGSAEGGQRLPRHGNSSWGSQGTVGPGEEHCCTEAGSRRHWAHRAQKWKLFLLLFIFLNWYLKISSSPHQSQLEIIRIPIIPDGVSGSSGCAETPLPLPGEWKILPWHCQHIWCCSFFVFQTRKVESISSGRRHAVFINAVTDRSVVILTHQHWLGPSETEIPALPRTPAPAVDQNWSWLFSALPLPWTAQWQN